MRNSPSLWFYTSISAFTLGILARSFIDFGLTAILWLAFVALALTLVRKVDTIYLFLPFLILCFALGALRLEWASLSETNPILERLVQSEVTLNGVVVRDPEDRANSIHLYVETEYGLILVTTEKGGRWKYGDTVLVQGTLERPESFETDLGRTFNYRGYLLAKGVAYTVGYADVSRAGDNQGNFVIGHILDWKHNFMHKIEVLIPEPAAGLGEGLLLGVKRALGEELEETFRRTGIIHIVVLSGYNVMIVVYFILTVFRSFLGRRTANLFGLVAIALFAVLVGLGATVIRATIMAALLLIMGLTGRIYLVTRGLFLAGFLMLLWNPYSLAFDTGFQLSFLATLGLIFISQHLDEKLKWLPNTLQLREFLVATVSTQIFVLPLLLYQMGEFSVVAVIVNVLALPMVAPAMLLTLLTGVVGFFSLTLAAPIAYVTHLSLSYIIFIANWFGALPFASFTVPAFSFWFVPLGYLVIVFFLWKLNRPVQS